MTPQLTAAAAGLFLMATAEAYNVFSALTSSPWTMESFGADERRAKAGREYVLWAVASNFALGLGTSLLVGNLWPLAGIMVVTGFMMWIYFRALRRGREAGATGWANGR